MPRFNEREFQAREDVRTLDDADTVRRDAKRLSRARSMAKRSLKAAEGTVKRLSVRSLGSRR